MEGSPVIECTCVAFDTALFGEVWFFWGTDGAGVFAEIIEGVFGTGSALFVIEVEVFGQVALYALLVCKEGLFLRTFATVLL